MSWQRIQYATKRVDDSLQNDNPIELSLFGVSSVVSAPILVDPSADGLGWSGILSDSEWARMVEIRDAIRKVLPVSAAELFKRYGHWMSGREYRAYHALVQSQLDQIQTSLEDDPLVQRLLFSAPDFPRNKSLLEAFENVFLTLSPSATTDLSVASPRLALTLMPEAYPYRLERASVAEYKKLFADQLPLYDAMLRSSFNDIAIEIEELRGGATISVGKQLELTETRLYEFIQEFCGFYESDEAVVVDLSLFERPGFGYTATLSDELRTQVERLNGLAEQRRMQLSMQWDYCGKLPFATDGTGAFPWKPYPLDKLRTPEERKDAFGNVRVVFFFARHSGRSDVYSQTTKPIEAEALHWVCAAYYTGVGPLDNSEPSLWIYDSLYSTDTVSRYTSAYSTMFQLVRAGFFSAEGIVTQDGYTHDEISSRMTGEEHPLRDMITDTIEEHAVRALGETSFVVEQLRNQLNERSSVTPREEGYLEEFSVHLDDITLHPVLPRTSTAGGPIVMRTLDPWSRTCYVQRNNWECGYFVGSFAKMLATQYLGSSTIVGLPPTNEAVWNYFQQDISGADDTGRQIAFDQRGVVPMTIAIPETSRFIQEDADKYGPGVKTRVRMYSASRNVYLRDFIQYVAHLRAMIPEAETPAGAEPVIPAPLQPPKPLIPRIADFRLSAGATTPATGSWINLTDESSRSGCALFELPNDPQPFGLTPNTIQSLVYNSMGMPMPFSERVIDESPDWFNALTEDDMTLTTLIGNYEIFVKSRVQSRDWREGATKAALDAIIRIPESIASNDRLATDTSAQYSIGGVALFVNFQGTDEAKVAKRYKHIWRDVEVSTLLGYLAVTQRRTPHVPINLAVLSCPIGSLTEAAKLAFRVRRGSSGYNPVVIVQENAGTPIGKIRSTANHTIELQPKLKKSFRVTRGERSRNATTLKLLRFQKLMFQTLWTLAAWDSVGFVHRDLWPPNVMIKSNVPKSARPVYAFEHKIGASSGEWVLLDPNKRVVDLNARYKTKGVLDVLGEQIMFIDYDRSVFQPELLEKRASLDQGSARRIPNMFARSGSSDYSTSNGELPKLAAKDTIFRLDINTWIAPPEFVFRKDDAAENNIGNTALTDVWSAGFNLLGLLLGAFPIVPFGDRNRQFIRDGAITGGRVDWNEVHGGNGWAGQPSHAVRMMELFGLPGERFFSDWPEYKKVMRSSKFPRGYLWTSENSTVKKFFQIGAELLGEEYGAGMELLERMTKVDPYERWSAVNLLFPDGKSGIHPFFKALVVTSDVGTNVPLSAGALRRQPWVLQSPLKVPREYISRDQPDIDAAKRHAPDGVFRTRRVETPLLEEETILDFDDF